MSASTTTYHSSSSSADGIIKKPRLIIIGTSAGGPSILKQILTQLPTDYPTPIIIVQHMPAKFTLSFASRLNDLCQIYVKQAIDEELIKPATVYIAPGGQQLLVKDKKNLTISIQEGSTTELFKPCIDHTLHSITPLCPEETLVIILTGMGDDGRNGCSELKRHNATVWAQDKQSSLIYGMPMAIVKESLADKILSPYQIGKHLLNFT